MKKSSKSKIANIAILLGMFLCLCIDSYCADAPRGPHGGQVVRDGSSSFEVKIDPQLNSVQVFSLKAEKKAPKEMTIRLFKDPDTSQTIELKAFEPHEQGGLPKFEGQLSPNAGSFVGFELRFRFDSKSLKALPYVPYIPSRNTKGSLR